MKHVFVINPNAGIKNSFEELKERISPFGSEYDIEIYKTEEEKDATRYCAEYLKTHPNDEIRFYACGGDGTLNEVANAIKGVERASMSIYPCGSGNDFVKAVGGAAKYENIKNLLNAHNKKIDVINVKGYGYCVNVCNFGFDAAVCKTANSLKGTGCKNPYGVGVFKALFSSMTNRITVEVDGAVVNPKGKMLLATLANGAFIGGKYKCAPFYSLDDGYIEVCLIHPTNIFTFIRLVKQYELGNHLTDPRFKKITSYRRGKTVKMYSDKPFDVCIDGEIVRNTRFETEIIGNALNFAIPD